MIPAFALRVLACASIAGVLALACSDSGERPGGVDPNGDGGPFDPSGDGGLLPDGQVPGLDTRPSNTTCKAPARPALTTGGQVNFQPAFPNMDFNGLAIGVHRSRLGASGPLRWFVVERDGDIWTFVNENASKDGLAADGVTAVEKAELFFDLPVTPYGMNGEGGLLGVALDPDFGTKDDARHIYVHYTTYPQNNVWRFTIGGAPGGFNVAASQRILTTGSGGGNHWGGDLRFGPDGFLYISLGDGGNGYTAADVQKLSWLRGKILRIDPRSVATGYAIPVDNPHAAGAASGSCDDLTPEVLAARTAPCPEVFATGFRNPWRMSFDRETGQLWVGDVGTQKEEMDLVVAGKNYGWTACDGVIGNGCPPASAASPFIAPVAQYREPSMASASVTGGYVYRGTALGTALQGALIFSDVYSGELFVLDKPYENVTAAPFAVTKTAEHPSSPDYPTFPKFRRIQGTSLPFLVSFAEDENAELLAVAFGDGKGQGVFRLAPPGAPVADSIPDTLSKTGCVDPADPKKPAAGVVPYDINAPFWSDGAEKSRFFAIPDGTTIAIGPDGDWELPIGSVTMKHFRLGGRLIETRLFVRHQDGGWAGYTYVWNDAETDAVRANPAGETRTVGTQTWSYPSRARCMTCHTPEAGGTLGLETRQLNKTFSYAPGKDANQVDSLAHVGFFATRPPAAATLPAFPSPFGTAPLEERARTYLHSNCQSCHRGDKRPSLHVDTPMAATMLCDAPAQILPGDPAGSPLVQLMRSTQPSVRMPKNAGSIIDEAGVKLIEEWIQTKTSCP